MRYDNRINLTAPQRAEVDSVSPQSARRASSQLAPAGFVTASASRPTRSSCSKSDRGFSLNGNLVGLVWQRAESLEQAGANAPCLPKRAIAERSTPLRESAMEATSWVSKSRCPSRR